MQLSPALLPFRLCWLTFVMMLLNSVRRFFLASSPGALLGLAALAALTWLTPLMGCGPNYGGRKEVKGTVKLKGQPVDDGFIEFIPLSESIPTRSGAQILSGAYRIPAESGLMPGKYRVSITAGDGRTKANAAEDEPPGPTGANIVSKDRIPKEYNIESKVDVEVTEKGPNVFDYDIP